MSILIWKEILQVLHDFKKGDITNDNPVKGGYVVLQEAPQSHIHHKAHLPSRQGIIIITDA